ncbi:molybdopterin converting factor subunit 1 [Devosia sp.]|jgi:molybdopterin synthase sulfur carrier subunit|uniref:molybdopterin converting factor subunit 1 n=1 Tax=Devosia sp. TaxID=1871048 RepID=UPI0037BE883F
MKILYFAMFRERLNRSEEELNPPAEVKTVADLIAWLRSRDEAADLAFEKPSLVRAAIDTKIVKSDALIANAQTVALFPPMTGG